jgi:hypothetical protein
MAEVLCPQCKKPSLRFQSRNIWALKIKNLLRIIAGLFLASIIWSIYMLKDGVSALGLLCPTSIGILFFVIPIVAGTLYGQGETRCMECGFAVHK